MNHQAHVGQQGEAFVCVWLQDQGFQIIAQNYRTRTGEVDIIAMKDELLSFIEVKTRLNSYFPLQAVITPSKQKRTISAAKHFLLFRGPFEKVCRFDVALVEQKNGKFEVEYIPDAFRSQG